MHDVLLCDGEDHRRIRRDLPALCSELEDRLPGTSFTIARLRDYVGAVEPTDLPAWTGELLGSRLQNVLRGVNSARLYLKRANERAERRLLEVETLGALRTAAHAASGFPPPTSGSRGASCSSAIRTTRSAAARATRFTATCSSATSSSSGRCRSCSGARSAVSIRHGATAGVVNLLPYRRRCLVELPGMEPATVELDGFSARPVELIPTAPRTDAHPHDGTAIESDCIRVEAAPDGTLTVLDKATGRRFDGLHRLEDEPDVGDLYNFCPVDGAGTWRPASAAARVLRDGPLVHELEVRTAADTPSLTVTTIVRLIDGIRRVEFTTTIDNGAEDHRLRAVFPVAERRATSGPRGSSRSSTARSYRPPPRTEWCEPPDPTQHTLGAVALGPLAIVTKGLPEYEARPTDEGAELCVTLLRCVGMISRRGGEIATRPVCAGPPTRTPDGQCLGRHEFEYALVPGADELDDAELLRASQDYRYGFLVTPQPVRFDPPVNIDGDVVFSCLKGAEDGDGLILRCFNPKTAPGDTSRSPATSTSHARVSTKREEGAERGFELGPGEVATFRLRPRA